MATISAQTPLARLLLARGLTQHTLAKATGCSQASVSRLINGLTADAQTARRVCDYLDPPRAQFNELLLLYPERFRDWEPNWETPTPTA